MNLYFCRFADLESILINDESKEAATAAVTELAKVAPVSVVAMPARSFCATFALVEDEEAEEGEDEWYSEIAPFDHSEQALTLLENGTAVTEPPPAALVPRSHCGAEAEDEGGNVVKCSLPFPHPGQDHAGAGLHGEMVWPQEGPDDAARA